MPDSNLTKHALAQAMKDLMRTEPFSKISVGDICQICHMSRKSFYYHFRDKYDLVNWIFDSEFLQTLRPEDYRSGWALLADLCAYFYREQEFYRGALQITGQNSFREYFSQAIAPIMAFFAQDIFEGVEHKDFYVTFFSDAILISIIRWLTEGAQFPPEEYLGQLRHILVRLARHTIEQDDQVDDFFNTIRNALGHRLTRNSHEMDEIMDYLMIVKYLERVGDHAVNICEWVEFYKTGALKQERKA